MAFVAKNLRMIQGKADGIQLWGYETDDLVAAFSAASYFPTDAGLRNGDHVLVSLYADVTDKSAGATGAYHLVVSSAARANIDVDVTVA